MSLTEELQGLSLQVDRYLEEYFLIQEQQIPEKNLLQSMLYSLMSGGKRIRPALTLTVAKMLDTPTEVIMPYAAAIEMIHTYSLIHDDLPAMDNDDYRRGRLTNHKVYGEATAILAGDALLNEAFELLMKASLKANRQQAVEAALMIANAAGKSGMIGGQVIDMESEGKNISEGALKEMHRKKTGALLKASVLAPAVLTGASGDETEALCAYAEGIGIAFQIKDDILDVESTMEELGKPVGSDQKNHKTTYVSLFGLNQAKEILSEVTEKAVEALKFFGKRACVLREIAFYIAGRTY